MSGAMGWALVQMLVALAAVCAGAYLVLRFGLRRLYAPAARGPLRVVARCPLEPRRSVFLVRAAGRCFLLGAAEGGVTLLAEVDPAQVEGDAAR